MVATESSARLPALLGLLILLCGSPGCRTYDISPAIAAYQTGDLDTALDEVQNPPVWRKHYDHDQLLWMLEEGKILQDLGRFEESSEKLAAAMERFRYVQEQQASISITQELRVILQGLIWMEYRASFAIGVHANTLLALSDLASGRPDNALASTIEAYNWQLEIEQRREKELNRVEAVGSMKQLDNEALITENESTLSATYLDDEFTDSVYKSPKHDYLNPFAIFVSALMKIINNDTSGAETDLRLVEEILPNSYVTQLRKNEIDPRGDTVYVLFERGLAPQRVEDSIVLPTPHLGVARIAWPRLRYSQREVSRLAINAEEQVLETQPLASFDRIVATQFRHDLPGILIRTIIAAAAREGASQAVQESKLDDDVKVGFNVLAQLWKVATSATDLRTWRTAGSEYQLAVLPRPAAGQIDFNLLRMGGSPVKTVHLQVEPSDVTVVWVRSIGSHTFNVSTIYGGARRAEDITESATP